MYGSTTRVRFLKDLELSELAMLPLTLKSASVSADSSIGDRNRRRFFFLKREKEKALAATVTVTNNPASFVAVTKSATNDILMTKRTDG
jgi:hypothetical protein